MPKRVRKFRRTTKLFNNFHVSNSLCTTNFASDYATGFRFKIRICFHRAVGSSRLVYRYSMILAVALLTSPLPPLLLPFLARGRCYRTWVLTIYQFFYLSLSGLSPQRTSPFYFQKARWDGFASYFDFHCPSAEEYSFLCCCSLALNAAKSSIPFGCIKRHPKVWWSAEVESVVGERRKAFAAVHRSDEDRQAYISASRRASSVIAKAKAEAWQSTCSFSPKSKPKSVHSLLRSIAGSPNFPNCFSPRESSSIYAAYLRSHFSVSQSKALRSRARGYLSEVRRALYPVESHSSFSPPFLSR